MYIYIICGFKYIYNINNIFSISIKMYVYIINVYCCYLCVCDVFTCVQKGNANTENSTALVFLKFSNVLVSAPSKAPTDAFF